MKILDKFLKTILLGYWDETGWGWRQYPQSMEGQTNVLLMTSEQDLRQSMGKDRSEKKMNCEGPGVKRLSPRVWEKQNREQKQMKKHP